MNDDPSWLDRRDYPFLSRFVPLDGHVVHYVDEGEGPAILFLHGNPTWSFVYRRLVRELRGSFRCIALDYPGFGLSRAAAGYDFRPASHSAVVEKLVQRLELRELTLFAHDWGGPIGLGAASRMPDRFHALVLGNTWAWPIDGDPHFERFSSFMGGPFGGWLIRNFNFFVNVMIPMGLRRGRLPAGVMRAYRGPFPTAQSRLPTHVFPREIRASSAFLREVESGLARLRHLPLLLLWPDGDIAFRASERQRLEAVFPRHRTHVLANAGHYFQEEAFEECLAHFVAWWQEVGLGGKDRIVEMCA
ncbi:MAG TPA: alpha/beta fold hydrolase [Candidatus Limnocylindrales bacterium]|nr:alpha/beta fold hydrolase [Candidatus Limnocylindrales bacterium]